MKANLSLLSLGFLEALLWGNLLLVAWFRFYYHALSRCYCRIGDNWRFLYPNQTLIDQDILNRKGFPESYDMETLLNFLDRLKNGQDVDIPVYSHEVYDIVPGEKQRVKAADFVIVEGINVFQTLKWAPLHHWFLWFLHLCGCSSWGHWKLVSGSFLKTPQLCPNDPNSYYRFRKCQLEKLTFAHQVWTSINLTNLQNYIEPTRNRAEVILHKTKNHEIDEIYLKKIISPCQNLSFHINGIVSKYGGKNIGKH